LKRVHQGEFQWDRGGATLDTLVGTRAVRTALEAGEPLGALLARDAAGRERWLDERRRFLIY
jgi:hypothetical protein